MVKEYVCIKPMKYDLCFLENNRIFLKGIAPKWQNRKTLPQ